MAAGKSKILAISIIGDSTKAQSALGAASKSVSSFSKTTGMVAGAVAGFFSSMTTRAVNYVSNLSSEMIEASDSADKFKSTLSFAGVKDSEIKKLTSSTQSYADKTVFSLRDIRNTTAQLAANGVKGYGTLAQAAGNLTAVAGGGADAFKSIGMVLTQTAGAGKLTTENWNQLSDAIPGASGKLQEAMKKNGAFTGNFRDAMEKGEISADEFNTAVQQLGMTDAAKKAAASTKTIEGAAGNFQAALVKIGASAISKFKPQITGAMNGASGAITGIADAAGSVFNFFSAHSDVFGPIAIGVGILVGAFTALQAVTAAGGIIAFVKGLTLFQNATKIATGVQAAFNLVMNANPIFLIITAIMAVTAALVWFFTQTDTGRQVWSSFIGWLQSAWASVGAFFQNLWAGIQNVFWTVVNAISGFLQSTFGQAILAIFAPFIGLPNLIIQNWGAITGFFGGIVNGIIGFVSSLPTRIGGFFNSAKNFAMNAWNGAVGAFHGIVNGIIGVFTGLGDAISSPFRSAFGAIKSLWNSTVGGFGFTVPDWIPGVGGKSFKIPMLAKGGILTAAGTVMVGEAGPELLSLPAGAQVTPLNKANYHFDDQAQPVTYNYYITISGELLDPDGTAKKIKKVLTDYDRKRGN